jgi:hypothetical protein
MAFVMCIRCDKFVDLDWNVEEIIYINNNPVCLDCASEEEVEAFEAECEAEYQRKKAKWGKNE